MAALGNEVHFVVNDFQQPKQSSLKETVAQMIINLFFMRPGNLPSMPQVGIDIRQYLYTLDGSLNSDEIVQKLYNQCSQLIPFITTGEVKIFIAPYNGVDVLIVAIPITGIPNDPNTTLLIGFTKTSGVDISYTYQFQQALATL